MSYDIVKSIAIKGDKVFITAAASNVSPRTFECWQSQHFSDVYQKGGMPALLKDLAEEVWYGNYHLRKGSQLCRYLQAGFDVLTFDNHLRNFLDADHAAQFMCDFALNIISKGKSPMPDASALQALRKDKEAVLDVCKKRPAAFDYSAPEVQQDRETAREYITNCCNMIMFSMPFYFRNDKELAMLALKGNGCVYRDLSPSLRTDKEITRLAFDPNQPRKYFEHLPDLIPESLRKDKAFMKELVALCPQMHLSRAKDLLIDKDIVKTWFEAGTWNRYNMQYVPSDLLKDPEVQKSIFASPASDELKAAAKEYLSSIGAMPTKPPLATQISGAENKLTGTPAPTWDTSKEPQR